MISRTSAFAFQGRDLEVTEIGRRLRVGTALEGSVRKAGDRVRITAQLVNAEDGYQVWSKRFDRKLSDVFAIQDEIAAAIVNEFRDPDSPAFAAKRAPFDVPAHDAYLRGMYALNKRTDEAVRRAMTSSGTPSLGIPGSRRPTLRLAEGHIWFYSGLGILPASGRVPEARSAVEKALELDPTLADAHKVRALIAMNHDWDRNGAEEALTARAAVRSRVGGGASLECMEARASRGAARPALIELEEAERLDPLDLQVKTQIGYVHYFHHDLDRALAQFEKVVELEPSFAFAHYAIGDVCTQKGEYDRAIQSSIRRSSWAAGRSNHVGVLGYAYGRSGNRDRATAALQELTERATHGYVSAMWMALVHLGLGDLDSLFHWLDRAFEERDGSLILITAAVEFDPVRDDPRFKALWAG